MSFCSSPHLYVGVLNVKGMMKSFFKMNRTSMKIVYKVDSTKHVCIKVLETIIGLLKLGLYSMKMYER